GLAGQGAHLAIEQLLGNHGRAIARACRPPRQIAGLAFSEGRTSGFCAPLLLFLQGIYSCLHRPSSRFATQSGSRYPREETYHSVDILSRTKRQLIHSGITLDPRSAAQYDPHLPTTLCHTPSFRGAAAGDEPGIQRPVFMDSGPGPLGHPGMTIIVESGPAGRREFECRSGDAPESRAEDPRSAPLGLGLPALWV